MGLINVINQFLQERIPWGNRDRNCKIVNASIRGFAVSFNAERIRVILLMFLRRDRATSDFEVGSRIGQIGLMPALVTKTDRGKDTHDPIWFTMVQPV